MTRDEVLARLRPEAPRLRAEFSVRSLALFGSTARNEATDASDIDLLIEFDRPAGLFHLIRTQNYLEGVCGRSVDLVTPGGLKPRVRKRVLAEAIDLG
jgi:predicted nucleotidyltransferase